MKIDYATNASLNLVNLTGIDSVDLSGSSALSAAGLLPLVRSEVSDVNLSACLQIDDSAMEVVAKIPFLRSLNLDCCLGITDAGIAILTTAQNLRSLTLRWCHELTDDACKWLATMRLTELSLEGIESISDSGAKYLASILTIRELVLPEHSTIADEGICAISAGMINLESITIAMLDRVSEVGIRSLGSAQKLRRVTLVGMKHIPKITLETLKHDHPNLQITHIWLEGVTKYRLDL